MIKKIKTKEEIIEEIERVFPLKPSKFYINGLLFCLDRKDLMIETYSDKQIKNILAELKKYP
jgi:hypothetical protein